MAPARLVEESQATGSVKAIFTEIKAALQVTFVPKLFRALAADPAELAATWEELKAVMLAGLLDPRTKAMAALAVAMVVKNPYVMSAQTAALRRLGATAAELEELTRLVQLTRHLAAAAERFGLDPDLRG